MGIAPLTPALKSFPKGTQEDVMKLFSAIKGAALGAGLMYLFDPELGDERRERLREQMNDAVDRCVNGLSEMTHDLFPTGGGRSEKSSGGRGKSSRDDKITRDHWDSTTRMAAATLGGTLLTYGARSRFPIACVLGTAGLALVSRATHTETSQQEAEGRRSAGNQQGQESGERKPAKVG